MTFISPASGTNLESLIWNQLLPGFDPQQIISAMMQSYEQPIEDLQAQQQQIASQVSDYQQINTDVLALESAANAIASPSGWGTMQATSSDSSVATATASAGAEAGSVSFVASQLASADVLVSSGQVASTASTVTSASDLLLSQATALGFAALASSGLSLGSHTITVEQASQAAVAIGSGDVEATGASISSTNDTITINLNGTNYTITIPTGTYSGASLLSAIESAIGSAGLSGTLKAGFGAGGQIILATVDQGSSQTLQVTGGSALSALGLSAMAAAAQGSNAVVNVDGTANTLTTVAPGGTYTLSSGTGGSVLATVETPSTGEYVGSSLISVGSTTATDVSTGNGSLASVVQAINSAGVGFSASAVQTSSGYELELTANSTGAASDITVSPSAFSSSSLGNLITAAAGQDAVVNLGSASGPEVTSSTNTFSGLLPGVDVTLESVSSSPVTVTVSGDAAAEAQKVQNLVDAANSVLSDIQKYAGYDASTKTAGPLMTSGLLQGLTQQILSIVAQAGQGTPLGSAMAAGLGLTSDGNYTQLSFNQTAFENAYSSNPSAVQALFAQGGTFAPSSSAYSGEVSLVSAGTGTVPGSYSVVITHSASQAVDTGTALSSGTVSAAETLTIAMGGKSVQFSTFAGESLSQIASGLNQAFQGAGMALGAQVTSSGTQLQIVSDSYGSSQSFTVSSSNTASGTTGLSGTFTGSDVAGTIDGQAATGNGQFLTAASGSPLDGMVLQVTVPGITSSTNIGTFTYSQGLAGSYAQLANSMANPVTGQIGYLISGLQHDSESLNPEISFYQQIASNEQQMLNQEFTALLGMVSSLHNQSSFLSNFLTQTGLG
jgi:flagellar hook-associated protein 2